MFWNAREKLIKADEIQMNCISFGTGKKVLVMIQGLSTKSTKGSSLLLAYMYRIFAKDYTVYLFDRREPIGKEITVRELAADIAKAMVSLGIQNADVFGVSQGGMIAQYLAIDRPDLVNKMVLAVTLSRNNETIQSVIGNWIAMTEQRDYTNLVKDMADKMYTDSYMRRYKIFMPLLTVFQKPKDVPRFITLAKACLTCNAYEELHNIQCPVFVIGAKKDKVTGGEASQIIADKLGCQSYIYDDFGHAVYEEAKDFNRKVYDFFQITCPSE